MATLALGIGSSHGPTIQSTPEHIAKLADGDTRDPRFDYQALLRKAKPGLEQEIDMTVIRERHQAARAALKALNDRIAAANLDMLVVISNTHRVPPTGAHPVFGVLRAAEFSVVRRAEQPFDPDLRFVDEGKRPPAKNSELKPGQSSLANHIIDQMIAGGFDVACTDDLPEGVPLDDAFTYPYEWLMGGRTVPLVPFNLSRDLPNQAYPGRCYEAGVALGQAIESWPEDARVGIVASGGLSHQIIDEELDHTVITALVEGDQKALSELSRDRLNGAPGTPEILNWIAVAGAMAPRKMTLIDYQPIYRSLAGTGHGLTFGYWP